MEASGKIDFGCSDVPEDEHASALFVLRSLPVLAELGRNTSRRGPLAECDTR